MHNKTSSMRKSIRLQTETVNCEFGDVLKVKTLAACFVEPEGRAVRKITHKKGLRMRRSFLLLVAAGRRTSHFLFCI